MSRIIKSKVKVTAPQQILAEKPEKTEIPKMDNLLSQATKMINEASQKADSIIKAAETEAKQLLTAASEQSKEEAAAAKAQAQDEGYQAGYQQGFQSAQKDVAEKAEAALASLEEIIAEAAETRSRALALAEDDFLKLSLVLAEKIIKREIISDTNWLQPVIKDVIRKIADVEEVIIRINPDDYQKLTDLEDLTNVYSGKIKIQWELDDTLQPGSCLISSEFGLIDASLDRRFLKLTSSLQEVIYNE